MRCLLVDNDPVFLKLMEKILFKEGHEILQPPTGFPRSTFFRNSYLISFSSIT